MGYLLDRRRRNKKSQRNGVVGQEKNTPIVGGPGPHGPELEAVETMAGPTPRPTPGPTSFEPPPSVQAPSELTESDTTPAGSTPAAAKSSPAAAVFLKEIDRGSREIGKRPGTR